MPCDRCASRNVHANAGASAGARRRPRATPIALTLLGALTAGVSCGPSGDAPAASSRPEPPTETTSPRSVPSPPSHEPAEPVSISPERRQEVERGLQEADALRKGKKLDAALAALEGLGPASELPPDLASTLLYHRGRALFQKAMDAGSASPPADPQPTFRAAERRLAEVVGAYPTEADAASASYLLGSTRLMLDDLEGALKTYQETYDRFPQYENRSRALLRTGVCLAGMGQPDRAREAFQRVVDRYPSTDANVRKATKYLQEISIVGRPAPGVVADRWLLGLASEGDALQLFQGEVVVLVFFATWCENCEAELPHLRKLIDRWTQRGAVFLGIANPEDPKNTSPVDVYVQKNQIPFHDVALDRRSRSWGPYRVSALPAAVVIDRERRIAWRGHPSFFPTPLIDRLLRGASR